MDAADIHTVLLTVCHELLLVVDFIRKNSDKNTL
jgi:hypothetical protein